MVPAGSSPFICPASKIITSSATRVYLRHVPGFALGEVLACPRVDEVPIPPTPSFICQCVQCGARIWVAHSSPIEPVRACVACSAAHDDQVRRAKQHRAMRPDEDRNAVNNHAVCLNPNYNLSDIMTVGCAAERDLFPRGLSIHVHKNVI